MKRLIAIFVILLAVPAGALEPGEALDNPADEARARALMAELRCLVCQNESIEASPSPFAAEVRTFVREQVAAGRSNPEIKAFLTDRYGDEILFRPELAPKTWVLWLGPFVLLGIGALVYVLVLNGARGTGIASTLSAEEEAQLAASLEERDRDQT